jgi:tetratricopeptide (TPR) repeat protein
LKPDFAQAFNNRGNAYAMQGDNARAIEDYDKAVKLVPNYASAYQNRAAAHEALGNRGEAIRDYRAALRLDPSLEDSKKGLTRLTAAR